MAALDGSKIGLTISIYDRATSGIDRIIEKLRDLQLASSSIYLPSGASSGGGQGGGIQGGQGEGSREGEGSGTATIYDDHSSTTMYISERLSRSDVVNILQEQQRRKHRG